MPSTKAVIASHRPWNRDFVVRLGRRCPETTFHKIDRGEIVVASPLAPIEPIALREAEFGYSRIREKEDLK